MHPNRRQIIGWTLAASLAPMLGLSTAHAQADWPRRTLKVVVPYPAGGTADAMGRLVAHKLGKAFPKVSVVVENISGGATVPGALAVMREPRGRPHLVPCQRQHTQHQPLAAERPALRR
ncbi:hypothetical protein N5J23_10565 [Comamonas aquatica]|uniref:Uncharacterized protein n=1 Tax=Comamonas aquatica TaxID=225991 RepID=A0AA43AX44_9BURK|nr:hypothetical protein [Comamonas aquatica]MDH1429166.1 hypothetical protein [Comamonas aquatica]MDH1606073.1 hypothetical protein [Comamonas aquatica]MDH1617888.1 hypothetical protein [Comamonas aquatica]MDH2005982.1 hypothetical protein [Comamonas aquatica]